MFHKIQFGDDFVRAFVFVSAPHLGIAKELLAHLRGGMALVGGATLLHSLTSNLQVPKFETHFKSPTTKIWELEI